MTILSREALSLPLVRLSDDMDMTINPQTLVTSIGICAD